MDIRKASDIDNLYERVKGYDLVLTVEAPLADALNNRLERPKLGEFAITPKRFTYGVNGSGEVVDEGRLFVEVVQRTDLSWKQAFYLLENVLSCWRHTGELRKILDYERFDNPATRRVLKILEETRSVYRAMEEFEPDKEKSTHTFLYLSFVIYFQFLFSRYCFWKFSHFFTPYIESSLAVLLMVPLFWL